LGARRRRSIGRRALARLSEFVVATAATMALLALGALTAFTAGGLCALAGALMALTVAVVMRTALVGTPARPPDFDELRLRRG
ncbi:hypothetical protein, partial [Bradyrhizobium jicamae]|uniref:hypothetical protein n=1 Tax=Bradyrhizobium jicamae TaxID=280332 RepID=UPI0032214CB8